MTARLKVLSRKEFKVINRIELNSANLLHNVDTISKQTGLDVIPVLKANAYGHGLKEVVSILNGSSVKLIAVDSYKEALIVKRETRSSILVMGAIIPDNFSRMEFSRTSLVVSRVEDIELLAKLKKKVSIHIEIDTGMARQGTNLSRLSLLLDLISKHKNIIVDGVMSHLADADNPTDDSFTMVQTEKFDQAVQLVMSKGFRPKWIHLAQSAGLTRTKSKFANTVRPGIVLFGINPLAVSDPSFTKLNKTRPVMSIWSEIVAVNNIEKGQSVGYSRSYIAKSSKRIGVIPFGYYEGLPRELSNKCVLLSAYKSPLPQVGNICMNHTMLDITDTDLAVGDKVNIISNDRSDINSIQSLCSKFSPFSYELLVDIAEITRRVIV